MASFFATGEIRIFLPVLSIFSAFLSFTSSSLLSSFSSAFTPTSNSPISSSSFAIIATDSRQGTRLPSSTIIFLRIPPSFASTSLVSLSVSML